jgi:hypothetical protein
MRERDSPILLSLFQTDLQRLVLLKASHLKHRTAAERESGERKLGLL